MILLSARNLTRQFDMEPVFAGVCFDVRPGEKIGLVGPNGSGKTTLLRILADLDESDTGRVERHPSVDVSLLKQQAEFDAGETLLSAAKAGLAHLYTLQRESAESAQQLASAGDPATLERLQKRYDHLQHELQRLDGYSVDHRVDEVLTGLGFVREDYERPMSQLSGGQQSRAMLARMLLSGPDVMLLDEPTNHLDIGATEWLEDYLARSDRAMILVSHDRYLLDRLANRIFELFGGRLTDYTGNFSAYWQQRKQRNKLLERDFKKQQEDIAKAKEFIRRNKYGQKHAQATDREKKLARIERVEVPQKILEPALHFGNPGRAGDWVIDAERISNGFGEPLFSDLTLRVERGDRIGVLGSNGCGKTTLLRTLLGEIEPDRGSVRFGTGVKVAYFDQQLSSVAPEWAAVDAVRPAGRAHVSVGELRDLLARFGIRGDMVLQKVGLMSGGEKSRVALARLAARNANLLVLDEPTNHLDLWARAALEEALRRYRGTVLFVTHDRFFIDRVATSLIVFEPGRCRYFEGNYSDYMSVVRSRQPDPSDGGEDGPSKGRQRARASAETATRDDAKAAKPKRRFPYRKVSDLEAEILQCEQRLYDLQSLLADPDVHRDGQRVKEAVQSFEETEARLEELYAHWEEAIEFN